MKRVRKGVPKKKWTSEEEAALKAGVTIHGAGQWRTILKNPQFASVLSSRSNVDLKDKWRNISVSAIWGSRKKAKLASKKTPSSDPIPLRIVAPPPLNVVAVDNNGPLVDATTPPAASSQSPTDFTQHLTSVEKMVLEAINNSVMPDGPDAESILLYVEGHFKRKNLKRSVTSRLRHLTKVGALVKIEHKYRISRNYLAAESNQRSPQLLLEGNKENSPTNDENGVNNLTIPHVNGVFNGIKREEAAAFVARLVAEAEFILAEAAEAARNAEIAEAKAEAERIFNESALETLEYWRQSQLWC